MARRKNILYVSCDSFKNTVTMFIVYSHYSVLLNVAMCMMLTHFGHVQLFITLLTVAHQAPLSIAFSRQECWSGLPFPFPGDLPDPGIKVKSPALAGGFFTTESPGKPPPTFQFLIIIRNLY